MPQQIRAKPKPYKIAEICYNPEWLDMPWYVIRAGVVAEQGGLNFGEESVSFKTLNAACNYLNETINRDMSEYKRIIEERK
jgi:hypothetical protein